MRVMRTVGGKAFQSTLSMRRATRLAATVAASPSPFQSTLSMRRATDGDNDGDGESIISIHALHEESDLAIGLKSSLLEISIHALHEESDLEQSADHAVRGYISIHALHEESDGQPFVLGNRRNRFQSTLSMRRATNQSAQMGTDLTLFQSTLSMRRATCDPRTRPPGTEISIHALHEESDSTASQLPEPIFPLFQSTLSMRRATTNSIAGGSCVSFQSTLSMRRATKTFAAKRYGIKISIHALHEESDVASMVALTCFLLFQSTLSMRRATERRNQRHGTPSDFNPRSP